MKKKIESILVGVGVFFISLGITLGFLITFFPKGECDAYDQFAPPEVYPQMCAYHKFHGSVPITLVIEEGNTYVVQLLEKRDRVEIIITDENNNPLAAPHEIGSNASSTLLKFGEDVILIESHTINGERQWYLRTTPKTTIAYTQKPFSRPSAWQPTHL